MSNLADRPGGLFFFKLSQKKKRMSSFVKSVERLRACLSSNCHTKGLWRRMSSFVKSVKRSGGLIFLQFVEKKGPQARLTDLTNLTSHFPGPGKKVPDPIPGSSEFRRGTAGAPRPSA